MDGVALKGLTVDFHEPGFVESMTKQSQQEFWFQLSDDQKEKVGNPLTEEQREGLPEALAVELCRVGLQLSLLPLHSAAAGNRGRHLWNVAVTRFQNSMEQIPEAAWRGLRTVRPVRLTRRPPHLRRGLSLRAGR
jgi:hypothetical protein